MHQTFLLYGSTGFVGDAIARLAVEQGVRPVLAGRNEEKLRGQAEELDLEFRSFGLGDTKALDSALSDVDVVLHCAGPFVYTYKPMVDACIRSGTHYLDITGEIPVLDEIARRDQEAKEREVMLLPAVGFDVVPTDCLAVHLKQRLPSATKLALAFKSKGPGGLPPGTQRTVIEMMPYGDRIRRHGRLEVPKERLKKRTVDFGFGPTEATRLTWGDVFTAYYSTGIPNIENYASFPKSIGGQLALMAKLRPLLRIKAVRSLMKRGVKPGPSQEKRSKTSTYVWGEAQDDEGRTVVSRLKGPEAGVEWTARAALQAVKRVLDGDAPPGFQTPGLAYGADFVLECEGVEREDVM